MTDNPLIVLFSSQLEAASAAAGWNYEVIQNYQPTQEGIPTAPIIFFEKLFDKAYGWAHSQFDKNPVRPPNWELNGFVATEEQWMETTFQVSALVIQDVDDLTLPTASDVALYVRQYITARVTQDILRAGGASILRVTDIRNPKFTDDRGLFEANPNFDVVLQHRSRLAIIIPGSDTVVGDIYPVLP